MAKITKDGAAEAGMGRAGRLARGGHLWDAPLPATLARWEAGLGAGVVALCVAGAVAGDSSAPLGAALGMWMASASCSAWLRRRGSPRAALLALGAGVQGMVCALCWMDGGTGSAFNAGLAGVVLAGALFGGRKAAWGMSAVGVGNALAMWVAQRQGWLPERMLFSDPLVDVVVQCGAAAAAAAWVSGALSRLVQAREESRMGEGQAVEAAAGFEAVFEKSSAPMALVRMAEGGRESSALAVNEAFRKMTGMGGEEAARPGAMRRLWAREATRGQALGELSNTGALAPGRVVLARADGGGGEIKCVVSAESMEWRGGKATLWTAMDISATVDLEERLELSNQEWRAKVGERAEILERARMELAKKERFSSLGEMVAGVSHEISTPLGNALLATSALQEPLKRLRAMSQGERVSRSELAGVAKKARTAAELALGNLARASEIIGSFKQLSADQAGGGRRAYKIESVLGDSARLMASAFRRKGVEWTVSCSAGAEALEMDGYPGALSQIASIMAQNALEHAFGGEVGEGQRERRWEAWAGVDPADPERARIEFKDNGAGVGPEAAARVFDPFFTTMAAAGSTGLGLSIAWGLAVEALGGTLELGVADGGGALFILSIPRLAPGKLAQAA